MIPNSLQLQKCIQMLTKAQSDYLDERKVLSHVAQIDGSVGPVIKPGIAAGRGVL